MAMIPRHISPVPTAQLVVRRFVAVFNPSRRQVLCSKSNLASRFAAPHYYFMENKNSGDRFCLLNHAIDIPKMAQSAATSIAGLPSNAVGRLPSIAGLPADAVGTSPSIAGLPADAVGTSPSIAGLPADAVGRSPSIAGLPADAVGTSPSIAGLLADLVEDQTGIASLPLDKDLRSHQYRKFTVETCSKYVNMSRQDSIYTPPLNNLNESYEQKGIFRCIG